MTAIVHALKEVNNTKARKFVIYTDSKSAIDAICHYNSFHPLAQKAQEWLYRINVRFKSVCFCWVPAHVGIKGNEFADAEAKAASTYSRIDLPDIPHTDFYKTVKAYIWRKWEDRWSSPLLANNKKYKSIRPVISRWTSVFHSNRRTEVVLGRLRIGHTHLTHKFLLDGSDAPECAQCDRPLSVEHILVHCQLHAAVRRNHGLAGKPLHVVLGDNADVCSLVKYLKQIGVFNKL